MMLMLKVVSCFIGCSSLGYAGMMLFDRADRRSTPLRETTLLVLAAIICFIVACALLVIGTGTLAEVIGSLSLFQPR